MVDGICDLDAVLFNTYWAQTRDGTVMTMAMTVIMMEQKMMMKVINNCDDDYWYSDLDDGYDDHDGYLNAPRIPPRLFS